MKVGDLVVLKGNVRIDVPLIVFKVVEEGRRYLLLDVPRGGFIHCEVGDVEVVKHVEGC